VFAACDAPGTAVRWSDLALRSSDGGRATVAGVQVNYQAVSDGGCATTNSSVDADGFVQRTGEARRTAHGARLRID
jgi:hypothetical protein